MKIKKYNMNFSSFFSLENKKLSIEKAYTEGIYADTPANRKLGRVGMSYAEWEVKTGKKEEKIDNISVYRLEKRLEGIDIVPKSVKDKGEFFLISLESEDFKRNNIKKIKDVLEQLDAKVYVSKQSHFIKAYKEDVVIKSNEQEMFKVGDYIVDINERILTYKTGEKTNLTPTEVDLLQLFASHPNKLISRESLLKKFWGGSDSRSMDVHIFNLKNKLNKDKDINLLTIPWKGYKLATSKEKSETKITAAEKIKEVVDSSKVLNDITSKELDKLISYSKSLNKDLGGVKVENKSTARDKKEAIANFFIHYSAIKGDGYKQVAEKLDTILKEALDNVDKKKKEKEGTKNINKVFKDINSHFGFEDEEMSWFADTPIALSMANDDEFSDIIDNFTEYDVISQKGTYKNDGSRKNMLNCFITYDIVPKGTLDEDVNILSKQFTIDNKTTIRDIIKELGGRS